MNVRRLTWVRDFPKKIGVLKLMTKGLKETRIKNKSTNLN